MTENIRRIDSAILSFNQVRDVYLENVEVLQGELDNYYELRAQYADLQAVTDKLLVSLDERIARLESYNAK